MTRRFERVCIAGVGLIGGSLALAARLGPALRAGAVVTDVGSVKARVVREVTEVLPAGIAFVGAHPIAGTEESGAGAARADLFRGAPCVLTPTPETAPGALAAIRALWEAVGAAVVELSPEAHDAALAWVSHVPHFLAFALMGAAPAEALRFAGPSFRDATRVAASSAEMWRDISLYNAAAIDVALEAVIGRLEALREAVRCGDAAALSDAFALASAARRRLTERW